jgi:DNA-binding SARP family transcriptional activator
MPVLRECVTTVEQAPAESGRAAIEAVRFRILGPLRVVIAGQPLQLGGPLEQSILLRLVLARSQPLRVERLADELWQEAPSPPSAGTVHSYVARLRRRFGAARTLLTTSAEGYRLAAYGPMVDAWRFDHALDAALAVTDCPAERCELLGPALRLWPGSRPFGALGDKSWAIGHAQRLQERRLMAIESLAEAELRLDRYVPALLRLQDVAAEHPHRESLTQLLMLALYRAGRQGDALAAYERCRRALDHDLGVRASVELRSMQQAILVQSPELACPKPPP